MQLPPLRMPSLRRPKKELGPDVVVPPRRRAIVVVQSCLVILLLVVVIGAWRSGRDDAPEEVASLAPTVPPVTTAPPTAASTVPPTTQPVASTAPSSDGPPPSTIGPTDVEPGTYDFVVAASAGVAPGEITRLSLGNDVIEFVWNAAGVLQATVAPAGVDETVTIIVDRAADRGYVRISSEPEGTWGSLGLADVEATFIPNLDELELAREQKVGVEELPPPVAIGLTDLDGRSTMVYLLELDRDALAGIDWDALGGTPLSSEELASVDRAEYRWWVTEDNVLVATQGVATAGPISFTTQIDWVPGPAEPFTLPDPALVEPFDFSQFDDTGTLTA